MTEANTASRDSLIGTHIDGRYTVHRELGRGGMGVVYEGVHDELGRAVAIKVLNTAWASDPTAVARFLREARTASSFSHGNIVDVSDLGRLPDGRPYLVMPKIAGVDLASLLRDSGVQPAKRVAELLTGVAAALDLIHAKGFVHRDIKPENLMYVVREDGSETVMLLDFGIAAAIMSNEPRLTGQGAIFGTPQFMPPEVCGGAMPDARGDVYALATVAFELITGHLPFGDDNMMRVLTEKLTSDPPTMSHVSGIPFPPELEHVIARGLARDPDVRFPSASEFVSSLKGATEHAPISWKSGVLRPSLRSDAHPVGSHSHPSTSYDRASEGRTPSGRPRPSPLPPFSSRPAPRMSTPRPEAPRANTPRPSPYPSYGNSQWPEGQGRGSQRPRSQHVSEPPWVDSYRDEEYQLGAGLRASERTRTRSVQRSRGGLGLLLLLIAAGTFAVVLWVRQEQPEALAALSGSGPEATTDQVPSAGPGTAQPNAPGVLAPAPTQPSVTANEAPAAAPLPNDPATATAPNDQPPGAATAQNPEGPSGAIAPADPNAIAAPAHTPTTQPQGPAAVTSGDPALQPKAVTPPPAAPPKVAAPPLTAAPKQAAAPRAQATPPRPAVPAVVPAIPPEPPAPSNYETAGSEFPQPEDSPVLTVQEETPPPEEEPELPVRPPEQQAAQLAKDATTALLAGEVSHAIDLLREATRLDPEHALAWRTLGLALERGGNRSGALNAYQQYIRLAPHGPQSDMVRERMRTLEQ